MQIILNFGTHADDPKIARATDQLKEFLESEEGKALARKIPSDKKIELVNYTNKWKKEWPPNTANCKFGNGVFETEVCIFNTNPGLMEWDPDTHLPKVVWILIRFGKVRPTRVVSFVRKKLSGK